MRENSDVRKIHAIMSRLAKAIEKPVTVYFAGGATAVLLQMRNATVDVDCKFEPDLPEVFEAIKELKESLNANIELVCPSDFVPPLPGWKQRCIFIEKIGTVSFFHYDLYTQVLAKIERGWELDLTDAHNFAMHSVDLDKLMKLFYQAEKDFIRYPALDFNKLKKKLLEFKNETSR